jgi:hypothetical protein
MNKIIKWMIENHKHPANIFLHILGPIIIIVGILRWNWIIMSVGAIIMPLGHLFEKKK